MAEPSNALLIILSIVGILALYWVLIGQWRHNKIMRKNEVEDGNLQGIRHKGSLPKRAE